MNKKFLIAFVVAALAATALCESVAQTGQSTVKTHSVALDSLFISHLRRNFEHKTIDGYRIQIYSRSGTSAKAEAQKVREKYGYTFGNQNVYVVYNAPFWRVRVGNFRYRSEALPLLSRVKTLFPGSYIVKDNTVPKSVFQ